MIEGYILLIILVGDTYGSEHVWNLTNHILGHVKDTYIKLEIQLANVVAHFFSQQARVKLPAANDLYEEQRFSTVQMEELKKNKLV